MPTWELHEGGASRKNPKGKKKARGPEETTNPDKTTADNSHSLFGCPTPDAKKTRGKIALEAPLRAQALSAAAREAPGDQQPSQPHVREHGQPRSPQAQLRSWQRPEHTQLEPVARQQIGQR